ncbi:MAG TPA: hypothetical protein VKB80_37065 [Kofleriaceae bacterium]|jgi:hypothetical protein|nr:hypothetical protein [Kofleriaceae bacterium]
MLKKILTASIAGAFATVLAAPAVMACPGHDESVAKKEDKASTTKTAEKSKKAKAKDKSKATAKKVISEG